MICNLDSCGGKRNGAIRYIKDRLTAYAGAKWGAVFVAFMMIICRALVKFNLVRSIISDYINTRNTA